MKTRIIIINILLLLLLVCGCKKFVEVDGPATSVSSQNVYNNDATAMGAITSLYFNMSSAALGSPGELSSLSCMAGLSADELTYYSGSGTSAFYTNSLTSSTTGFQYWETTYRNLYLVNSALEGLNASKGLSSSVKKQLLGEAFFMRGFYYFYLVNLYGDVPLVLTSDYTKNALIAKSPKVQVYQQIIADLKQAQNLLSDQYLKGDGITAYPAGTEERVRPTKWAAIALLARVYLYQNNWANAEAQASLILANTGEYSLVPLNQVFLKNNTEAIWQLQPVYLGADTQDAVLFVLPSGGPSGFLKPVYLNNDLVNSFNPADQRKSSWIGSVPANGTTYNFAYKYKVIPSGVSGSPVTEYSTVMRLAEQFLIRAEARAHLNNLAGAITDVDQIRERAGLPSIAAVNPGISQTELLTEILTQRRLELFTEWGHRWLDLKRTGNIDAVMSIATPKKSLGGVWKSYQQYYPISLRELKSNPNLTQVPGY